MPTKLTPTMLKALRALKAAGRPVSADGMQRSVEALERRGLARIVTPRLNYGTSYEITEAGEEVLELTLIVGGEPIGSLA